MHIRVLRQERALVYRYGVNGKAVLIGHGQVRVDVSMTVHHIGVATIRRFLYRHLHVMNRVPLITGLGRHIVVITTGARVHTQVLRGLALVDRQPRQII